MSDRQASRGTREVPLSIFEKVQRDEPDSLIGVASAIIPVLGTYQKSLGHEGIKTVIRPDIQVWLDRNTPNWTEKTLGYIDTDDGTFEDDHQFGFAGAICFGKPTHARAFKKRFGAADLFERIVIAATPHQSAT